jgi:DNA-binding HxlR family transcriptional regulator
MSRSKCPLCRALDIFGDRWSLLIVRDILLFGKTTYREFLDSSEQISTNILANRLEKLVEESVIKKSPHPNDGRKDIYTLTEQGIDLIPVLAEIMLWSVRNRKGVHIPAPLVKALTNDRERALAHFRRKAERGAPLLF